MNEIGVPLKTYDKPVNPISIYMIFTNEKEFNDKCIGEIWGPLVKAFEKILFSDITRIKYTKMRKRDITDVLSKVRGESKLQAEKAIYEFRRIWKESQPMIMKIRPTVLGDEWNWAIELRLNNSTEDFKR